MTVTVGEGGSFIDGELVHQFSQQDAQIPQGDFGSNDCFESGDDCDELFIGRMGAGCDCNYFNGLIDNLRIDSIDRSILAFHKLLNNLMKAEKTILIPHLINQQPIIRV